MWFWGEVGFSRTRPVLERIIVSAEITSVGSGLEGEGEDTSEA